MSHLSRVERLVTKMAFFKSLLQKLHFFDSMTKHWNENYGWLKNNVNDLGRLCDASVICLYLHVFQGSVSLLAQSVDPGLVPCPRWEGTTRKVLLPQDSLCRAWSLCASGLCDKLFSLLLCYILSLMGYRYFKAMSVRQVPPSRSVHPTGFPIRSSAVALCGWRCVGDVTDLPLSSSHLGWTAGGFLSYIMYTCFTWDTSYVRIILSNIEWYELLTKNGLIDGSSILYFILN